MLITVFPTDICKDDFPIKSFGLVFRGDNGSLTCDCSAIPTPSYTWKKDGTVLSFTGKKLVITNAQVGRDEGSYTCAVNSSGKTVQSLPHNLDVLGKYVITWFHNTIRKLAG